MGPEDRSALQPAPTIILAPELVGDRAETSRVLSPAPIHGT